MRVAAALVAITRQVRRQERTRPVAGSRQAHTPERMRSQAQERPSYISCPVDDTEDGVQRCCLAANYALQSRLALRLHPPQRQAAARAATLGGARASCADDRWTSRHKREKAHRNGL
eukprot:7384581-Prymnesium_polylepis.1